MHTRFETSILLPAHPEEIWEVLSDMTAWRTWTDVFDVGEGTPRPTWQVGTTFRVGPKLLSARLWAEAEIVEASRPHVLTWAGSLYGIPGRHGFVLEHAEGGGCRMAHWEACGGLGGRMAVWSGAFRLLERRFHEFNHDLREYLERQRRDGSGG